MDIRCPDCKEFIEVVGDDTLNSVACTTCGITFNLCGGDETVWNTPSLLKLGRFSLIEQVGRGAFGAVWKARDTQMDRIVALKVPHAGQLDSQGMDSFLREARAAAQIKHPNIVAVHEVGREDDSFYIVSDFIEGTNLQHWLLAQRVSPDEAIGLVIKVADALHSAHEAGVIHRDLKPGNIMLDSKREPYVTDFGLARRDVGEVTMTVEGQILGTPAYMSPEQARGEGHRADSRSDVYSLGVILFELLTGEKPFRGDLQMLMVQVLGQEPPSPRALNRHVTHDLETIIFKCLEKDPTKRYQSAEMFADDLRCARKNEPILARPIGRFERSWRWCNRNRLVASFVTVVLSSLVVIAIVATIGYIFTSRALQERNQAATSAERVSEFMTDLFRASDRVGFASGDNFEFAVRDDKAALVSTRELLARGAERIETELDDQPAVQATLMDSIGGVYGAIGLYEEAARLLRKSLNLRQSVLDLNEPKIAATMQNLGFSLFAHGQFDEAEKYYRESLRLRRQYYGDEHLEVTSTMYTLALLLAASDQSDEATDLMQQVIAVRRKLQGDKSQGVAIGLAGLAAVYLGDGKEKEAQSVIVEAYLIFRDHAGSTGFSHGMMDLLQGIQASHEDKYFDAVPLLEKSVQTAEEVLGGAHPYVAWCKTEYGKALEGLGRDAEAESNYREAIDIAENATGSKHIKLLPVRYGLARILQRTNRLKAAEEMLQVIVEDVRQVHGSGSPELANVIDSLANLQRIDSRLVEAEISSREALRVARIAFRDDVVEISWFLCQLARCLIPQEKTDEAIVLLEEALAQEAEHGTSSEYQIGLSLRLLANALTQSGQVGEAENRLRSAWQTAREDSDQTEEYSARFESLLGSWLVKQERFDEAESHLLASYSIFTKNLAEDHGWTKEARDKLRVLYQRWNKPNKMELYTDDGQSNSAPATVDNAR